MLGLVQGKVGEPLTFEGYADDYDKAIVAMEFSLDGGTTWTRHATEGAQAGRVLSWMSWSSRSLEGARRQGMKGGRAVIRQVARSLSGPAFPGGNARRASGRYDAHAS